MNTSNQLVKYRLSLINYAYKNGVTKTAIKYNTNRQYVYRWLRRYDGTNASLLNRSHKPKYHPSQHTDEELSLITRLYNRNKSLGLVMLWIKLHKHGYVRSVSSLYRILKKLNLRPDKLRKSKYIPKHYEQMKYCGQRVQIDVKIVPSYCLAYPGEKLYQYTAIDEYSRYRFLMAFDEHSSYSTLKFVIALQKHFKCHIECIQTDNGPEFTNRFTTNKNKPSLLDLWCNKNNTVHKLIKPFTPRHNGKVERSHRKDNEYFYSSHKFSDLADFQKQLKRWNYTYNTTPMCPLKLKSPQFVYNQYVKFGEIYEF